MEIDKNYKNGAYFHKKGNTFLPFIIDRVPKGITKAELDTLEDATYFQEFSMERISINKSSYKSMEKDGIKWYSIIASFFLLFIPISQIFSSHGPMDATYIFIVISIGLLFLIPAYIKWKNYKALPANISVIFDRYNSLITLPKADQLSHFTIKFSDLRATRMRTGGSLSQAASRPSLLFYTNPNERKILHNKHIGYIYMSLIRKHDNVQETWSMYVWYMDKNRPLPPGSAFDEYRQQDFERRKVGGFPHPLFKSTVPTAEATQEQQAEREKYWKDEDYMVGQKEAKYNLLNGFKDFKKKKKKK